MADLTPLIHFSTLSTRILAVILPSLLEYSKPTDMVRVLLPLEVQLREGLTKFSLLVLKPPSRENANSSSVSSISSSNLLVSLAMSSYKVYRNSEDVYTYCM